MRRVRRMKPFKPQEARALDAGEFARMFEVAVRAGERPQETKEFADPGFEVLGDDGLPLQMTDSPYNRAGLALKRRYGDDSEGFASAFYRFRALMDLISRDALGVWVRSSIRREGTLRIHPAVLDVASSMRLSKNGKFALKKFLNEVEATARGRYPDIPEWKSESDEPASTDFKGNSPKSG